MGKCTLRIIVGLLFYFAFLPVQFGDTADLDQIYTPLIGPKDYLYNVESSLFHMQEYGEHGNASFGAFDADIDFSTLYSSLKFSPLKDIEMTLGFGKRFSDEYDRLTYNPSGELTFVNRYQIDHFLDFAFDMRFRKGNYEFFLESDANKQDVSWHLGSTFNQPNFFTDIDSHFEDLNLGVRHLSESSKEKDVANLSQLTISLLDQGQTDFQFAFSYRNGYLQRTNVYTPTTPPTTRNYIHDLRKHYVPQILVGYGLNDNLQWRGGISFITNYTFKNEFQQFNPNGTTNFITALYDLNNQFEFPLELNFRPKEHIEIGFLSNFKFASQELRSWEKETNGTTTNYADKNLDYFNVQPQLKLTYLFDRESSEVKQDRFSTITKRLLASKQALVTFKFTKDITSLDKGANNGAQNFIDPYSIFLHPLDSYVSGSEYAAFFAGNTSLNATNISPQNHYKLDVQAYYGLTDDINIGLGTGYRSKSKLHHFTFADLASRYYVFEPYYYVDVLSDWRVTQNSLLSLKLHYVPQYKTFLDTDVHPKQFEQQTEYIEASLSFKVLF